MEKDKSALENLKNYMEDHVKWDEIKNCLVSTVIVGLFLPFLLPVKWKVICWFSLIFINYWIFETLSCIVSCIRPTQTWSFHFGSNLCNSAATVSLYIRKISSIVILVTRSFESEQNLSLFQRSNICHFIQSYAYYLVINNFLINDFVFSSSAASLSCQFWKQKPSQNCSATTMSSKAWPARDNIDKRWYIDRWMIQLACFTHALFISQHFLFPLLDSLFIIIRSSINQFLKVQTCLSTPTWNPHQVWQSFYAWEKFLATQSM